MPEEGVAPHVRLSSASPKAGYPVVSFPAFPFHGLRIDCFAFRGTAAMQTKNVLRRRLLTKMRKLPLLHRVARASAPPDVFVHGSGSRQSRRGHERFLLFTHGAPLVYQPRSSSLEFSQLNARSSFLTHSSDELARRNSSISFYLQLTKFWTSA